MAETGDLAQLFCEHGEVEELEFGDKFYLHLAERATYEKHQFTSQEVLEVHQGQPRYFENTGAGRRAPIIMVGPTLAGRFLGVPLVPAGRFGVWRPLTGFQANTNDVTRYLASH